MGLALSLSWPCPLSVLLLFRRFLVLTASSTDRNSNLARKRREKKGEERIAWSSDERRRRPSRSPSPPPFLSGSPLPRLIRLVSFAPLRHRGFHTVESTLTQREVKEAARDNPRIEPRAGNGQPPHDRPKSVLASLTSTPSFFLSTSSQKKTEKKRKSLAGRLQVPPVHRRRPPPPHGGRPGADALPHEALGHRRLPRPLQVLVLPGQAPQGQEGQRADRRVQRDLREATDDGQELWRVGAVPVEDGVAQHVSYVFFFYSGERESFFEGRERSFNVST